MADERESSAGPVGVVLVGDLEITITPLTMAEERALQRQIKAGAEATSGDYYVRCANLLKAIKAADPVAYTLAVSEIVRLTVTGPAVSPSQLAEYGDSPAGVATELFARGRKATPGLGLAALKAAVTVDTVDDVIEQLDAALRTGDGPTSALLHPDTSSGRRHHLVERFVPPLQARVIAEEKARNERYAREYEEDRASRMRMTVAEYRDWLAAQRVRELQERARADQLRAASDQLRAATGRLGMAGIDRPRVLGV